MAVLRSVCLVIFVLPSIVSSQFTQYNKAIDLKTVADCNQAGITKEYYDVAKLACIPCSQNQTFQISNGLSCICNPGYRYTKNFGGTEVNCTPCGNNEVASSTGYNCIQCPAGTNRSSETNTCTACPSTQTALTISPERQLDGTWHVVGTSTVKTIECTTCTADTQPSADNTRCEKCTTVLPITEDNSCLCPEPANVNAGGFCIPSGELLEVSDNNDLYIIPRTTNVASGYFQYNLRAAYALCHGYKNATACQVLGNLCVLTLYEYNRRRDTMTTACELYLKLVDDDRLFATNNGPWLYYILDSADRVQGDDVLLDNSLTTQYTFSPPSNLEFRVSRYSIDGEYKGLDTVFNGRLQLCADTTQRLNAAYVFGTTYSQSCKIAAIDLWDQAKYPLEFMDTYLAVTEEGVQKLFPIPVNILNYRSLDEGSTEINRGEMADFQLFRRFFLVDNIGTIPATGGQAPMVRYASSITIEVVLQTDTTQGVIYPPAITVEYKTVTLDEANAGTEVELSFSVDYSYTDTSYLREFQIAVGTLSTLGVIFAGYRTWVWSKRSGRPTMDFQTIANFFFFAAGTLANVFFVITFGMAFYWFIFFKRQSVVYLVHPSDSQLKDWLGLFGAAFALKFLEVAHLIFMQCTIDVFFIDWERSRGLISNAADAAKTKDVPVSIWRTYFVANEWNEIQAVRKINKAFQVWCVVFFLVVVGFEGTATRDPDGGVTKDDASYKAEYSYVYRYAVAVLVYMVTGIVQWIFFTFIYERFFEDKIRQFVDLCSMSNISVFVMANALYGHYIHGRSVHGRSDTNMKEMFEMMKKEEEDMCGQRGLLPNTEQQTFVMALPKRLRMKYETVLLPAQIESAAAASRADSGRGGRIAGTAMEKQVEAYSTINRFLSAFIDRSLRDIDYVIKDKTFLESVMDTEFYDTTETGIFYNDDGHSFDSVLFYGNEMTLLLFDVLTFCIADLIFKNFVVAGVITYLMSELVCLARDAGGQKNLAKKTLVDERFLI